MAGIRVEFLDTGIRINDLKISRREVADYLRKLPDEEREAAFIHAVEIGIFCLERARTSQETEFVKRQVESLLTEIEKAVGKIPENLQKALVSKIGTDDGQVLAPVMQLVSEMSKVAEARVEEVKTLLSQEIDPSKEDSGLGKALKCVRDLLDPKRTDSVQAVLDAALKTVTASDGELAKAVKNVVAEAVKPLAEEVDGLTKEIRGQEAAAEAIEQTIAKGASFEEKVIELLQDWKQHVGAVVTHVGTDNRPGDILIELPGTSIASGVTSIVIEARDQQSAAGYKPISRDLVKAMEERNADSAIYLSRSGNGLAQEVGDWGEGELERGPFVATTSENLFIAIRFLISMTQVTKLRALKPDIDAQTVVDQLERIRNSLKRIGTINRNVGDVHRSANAIQSEAEDLREEIRSALNSIESAIRVVGLTDGGDSAEQTDQVA